MQAKTRIKHAFAAASVSYDSVALLQCNVGRLLLQRIGALGQLDTIVDLGCGTGFLIKELLEKEICTQKQIISLDIALPMLQTARNKLKSNLSVTYLCADAEFLPFIPQSADLVISNLALQWCHNLEKALSDVKRILKPGGRFFFTTFGPRTLHELKSAWKEVDNYTHVNTFYSAKQLTEILRQTGFEAFQMETHTYVSTYESVWDLMAELKGLGAKTVKTGRKQHLTSRATMQRMIRAYQKQDENGLVPATFEVVLAEVRAKSL